MFPNLLKQTHRKIIEISGDGAYGIRKRVILLIPPREGAAFWERGHLRNLAVGCQKLYGSNKKWKNGMAIRDSNVWSETVVRWEVKPKKLQYSG